MNSLKMRILLLCLVIALAVGAILNGLSVGAGGVALQLPTTLLLVSVAFSAMVLWLGFQVSKFRHRASREDAPRMNPLLAARTVALAQTSAYVGSILAGWHVGIVFYHVSMLSVRSTWAPIWQCVIDICAGAIMLVIGIIVENMCKVPPGDSDDSDSPDSGARPDERESRGYARRRP